MDPGGWEIVKASRLILPLDTHLYHICRALGFTERNSADMRAALDRREMDRAYGRLFLKAGGASGIMKLRRDERPFR